MDVNSLLDKVENLVEHGPEEGNMLSRWRPMRSAMLLNIDDVIEYTQQIRATLPREIEEANTTLRDRDRILSDAHEDAENIMRRAAEQAEMAIRKAQEESRLLVANHEITRQAQAEGQRIVEQARQEGEAIRQGALEYARNVLNNLNIAIDNVSKQIEQLKKIAADARGEIKG